MRKQLLLCLLLWVWLSTGCGAAEEEAQAAAAPYRVHFINVGKGDCILLELPSHHLLIDTGYEATAGEVVAYLEECGVEELDALIITHFDKDHDGGAKRILKSIPVGTLYLPDYAGSGKRYEKLLEAAEENDAAIVRVQEDLSLSLGDAVCEIYASGVAYIEDKENDNDASLVITLLYGEDHWLFPGDIEKPGIRAYLAAHGDCQYDILKLPHHGRIEDNTAVLLHTIQPQLAIATDSKERPMEEGVAQLLAAAEISCYSTAQNGTVVISADGTKCYTVTTEY